MVLNSKNAKFPRLTSWRQATLLDGLGVCPLKWRVCGCGLNRFVYGGMNDISNVKVHLKTSSGNANIFDMLIAYGVWRLQQFQISIKAPQGGGGSVLP